jgi:hypothetical protein
MNLQTNVFDGEIKSSTVSLCGDVCVVKMRGPGVSDTPGLMPAPLVAGILWIGCQKSVEYAPDDQRLKIIQACDCVCAARIPLTMYYVKNTTVETVPVSVP